MSSFLRKAAPAVLVGTAAVVVVAAADDGLAVLNASDQMEAVSGVTGLIGVTDDHRDDDRDDDDHNDDDRDDDDDDDRDDDDDGGPADRRAPSGNSPATVPDATTANAPMGTCAATETIGPVVRTEWGDVQVAARVSNGRICGVRTIATPDGDRKSVTINARAVPALEQQVIATGDASFDGVSGATVTSDGYRDSLQAILDRV